MVAKSWKKRHLVQYKKTDRKAKLKGLYGITPEQYDVMLQLQSGRCGLCHREPKHYRLGVDHDHKSGRVRGLLCFFCNRHRLARAHDDTWPIYERIVTYLRSDFDGRNV